MTIAPADLRVAGVMRRKAEDERIDFFLEATRWAGEIVNREPEKCGAPRWADPDDLPSNVIPYVRQAWENGRGGLWFESFGWDEGVSLSARE